MENGEAYLNILSPQLPTAPYRKASPQYQKNPKSTFSM